MNMQPKPQRQNRRRGGSNRSQNSNNGRKGQPRAENAPISRAVPVRNNRTNEFHRKSGTDFINTVSTATIADGQVFFAVRIEPQSLPQMAAIGKSYQKVHYNHLTFQIASRMATTTPGGYIAGFIPDAADLLPDDVLERKRKLTSTPNSVGINNWKSTSLTVTSGGGRRAQECLPQRQFFTSESADPREFSPGIFYLIADGAVASPGTISLIIHWDVTFHVQSYETNIQEGIAGELFSSHLLYCYDTEDMPRSGDTATSDYLRWNDIFPNENYPGNGAVYRCEIPTTGKTAVEASQDVFVSYWWTTFSNQSYQTIRFYQNPAGTANATFFAPGNGDNTQVIWSGVKFTLESLPEQENRSSHPQSNSVNSRYHSLVGGGISNLPHSRVLRRR